jgi:hypothetical protein
MGGEKGEKDLIIHKYLTPILETMKVPNLQNNVRNPLGVIAMFVSFAYVSMVASFTIGIDKLNGASERLPIIWFLILFPLIIFIAFISLIILCNEKLFGPLDYRDDSSFILMNRHEIDDKADDKLSESNKINESKNNSKIPDSRLVYKIIQHNISSKLSEEFGIPFIENVKMISGRKFVMFDAVGQGLDNNYYVECLYLPSEPSESWYRRQASHIRINKELLNKTETSYSIIYALIVDDGFNKNEVENQFKKNLPQITIRWYNREKIINSVN